MNGLYVYHVTPQGCILMKTIPCCAAVAALPTDGSDKHHPLYLKCRALGVLRVARVSDSIPGLYIFRTVGSTLS